MPSDLSEFLFLEDDAIKPFLTICLQLFPKELLINRIWSRLCFSLHQLPMNEKPRRILNIIPRDKGFDDAFNHPKSDVGFASTCYSPKPDNDFFLLAIDLTHYPNLLRPLYRIPFIDTNRINP
jgi:hypothetical protein